MAELKRTSTPALSSLGPYGISVPSNLFETVNVTIEGPKSSPFGIRVTHRLTVVHVERGSISDARLQFADVITTFNGTPLETKKMFVELLKKHVVNAPASKFKIELKIKRPLPSIPMEASRMPREMEPLPGAKYRIGIIHMIPSCKLSLQIKSFNSKVYVTKVNEETLSSLALKPGDAIIDVDHKPVTSVSDTTAFLFKNLKEKGYVTMVIETPDDAQTKAFVRMALLAEKTLEVDLPMAPDVEEICRNELLRFSHNPDLKPDKSINRESIKKAPRPNSQRLRLNEQVEEIPVAADSNPDLLIKVPLVPASNYQPPPPASSEVKK